MSPVILGRTEAAPDNPDLPYDYMESLPNEFFKAGVKFAFGTFDNEFSRNLPYNAARASAYGLPQDEALKAVTINAAEIWGVKDKIGSIEKGKWADLMLTTGDPLEVPTQIKAMYIKGKEVDLSNKQTKLYDKYLARPFRWFVGTVTRDDLLRVAAGVLVVATFGWVGLGDFSDALVGLGGGRSSLGLWLGLSRLLFLSGNLAALAKGDDSIRLTSDIEGRRRRLPGRLLVRSRGQRVPVQPSGHAKLNPKVYEMDLEFRP